MTLQNGAHTKGVPLTSDDNERQRASSHVGNVPDLRVGGVFSIVAERHFGGTTTYGTCHAAEVPPSPP
jgi:hypothetical protein